MWNSKISQTQRVFLRMMIGGALLFISIYFPRYTHVSKMRQIICASGEVRAVGRVLRANPTVSGQWRSETEEFVLLFSQQSHPSIGEKISYIGEILKTVQCENVNKITLIVRWFSPITDSTTSPFYIIENMTLFLSNFTENYLQKAEREMSKILSPTQQSILFGMTIGRKPDSTAPIATTMKAAGMTHVLVASGANLAIILLSLRVVLRRFFSKNLVICLSLLFATVYAGIVGNQAPILRALCMYWLMSIGLIIGRKMYWQYILALTAGILLIYQPLLLYSLSFWLTITATIGVFLSNPDEASPSEYITSLRSTWIVFLWTFPLLSFAIGSVTLVTLISSFFLLWLVGPITIVGMALIVLAPILPSIVTQWASLPLWFMLEVFSQSVGVFSKWDIATMTVGAHSVIAVFAQYLLIIAYFIRPLANGRSRR